MANEDWIPAKEFCVHHEIEVSFISSLGERGLIEINEEEENLFIPLSQLPQLEKILRFYEMDINLEGIEVITHLLEQMERQREEMSKLISRLRVYEDDREFG